MWFLYMYIIRVLDTNTNFLNKLLLRIRGEGTIQFRNIIIELKNLVNDKINFISKQKFFFLVKFQDNHRLF